MNGDMLKLDCAEWRDVSVNSPAEMEVVIEMMIEAGEELCYDKAA
jgi:hypothetical protein